MAGEHFFLELEPPEERLRKAPHVVVVGGGFAGVRACKALAQADVRVTLVDKRNFNLFQPLLYQVATGLVSRGDVATPLRQLVGRQRNVQVLLGEVTEIHPEDKKIVFRHEDLDGVNPYDPNDSFRSEDSLARESLWESGLYGEWTETTNAVLEPKVFRGEEVITRAILEVAGKPQTKRVAYFTRGHGESSPADVNAEKRYSELRRLLEDRNLMVSNIDLGVQESIPKDAKLLIIAGPKATFLDKEVSLIRNFLN